MGALTRLAVLLGVALCALVALVRVVGAQLPRQPILAHIAQASAQNSPRKIALYSPQRRIAVNLMSLPVHPVVTVPDFPLDIAAAPDGKHLSIVTRTSNGDTLTIFNPYTGQQTPLIINADAIDNATWSPDGTRIAYETQRHLHIIDAATGERQQRTESPPIGYPRWSPDGDVIAVLIYPDVYTMDIDTGGFTRIIDLPQARRAFTLAWSPDGHYLAYTRLPQDPDVYVYDTQTANVQRVRLLRLITVREVTWRDATHFVAIGGRTPITPAAVQVDITTGDVTRFLLPPNYSREATWLR